MVDPQSVATMRRMSWDMGLIMTRQAAVGCGEPSAPWAFSMWQVDTGLVLRIPSLLVRTCNADPGLGVARPSKASLCVQYCIQAHEKHTQPLPAGAKRIRKRRESDRVVRGLRR
ncbi:MAG: hypothetical protein KJZ62_11495 [Fimbriimonadaceae bacterium]|nr:hypothetical protein [Fimbriimonadaceae bacterium]QOJ12961.1 MAG: hypothetical protein HRU74_13175 [Chthonomonadaceae bacterium]